MLLAEGVELAFGLVDQFADLPVLRQGQLEQAAPQFVLGAFGQRPSPGGQAGQATPPRLAWILSAAETGRVCVLDSGASVAGRLVPWYNGLVAAARSISLTGDIA
jgi:hypothetical protein